MSDHHIYILKKKKFLYVGLHDIGKKVFYRSHDTYYLKIKNYILFKMRVITGGDIITFVYTIIMVSALYIAIIHKMQ